jgi:hypothetical protein
MPDMLAITLYRSNGGVWYSSQWDGTKTIRRVVDSKDCVSVPGSGTNAVREADTSTQLTSSTQPATPETAATKAATETEADVNGVKNLLEAYPNPMAEQATIHFHTQDGGKAQVYLYNQMGQLVSTLYNAEVRNGEEHFITLQRNNLPAGV